MNSPPAVVYEKIDSPRAAVERRLTVEETWAGLRRRMAGADPAYIDSARAAFAAGVFAASCDITINRTDARELSEAAERIERGKV